MVLRDKQKKYIKVSLYRLLIAREGGRDGDIK